MLLFAVEAFVYVVLFLERCLPAFGTECTDIAEMDHAGNLQLSATTQSTTTKTTTTLSAPPETVRFTSKGGELWPFVADTFKVAREEATQQLKMKGWLKGTCADQCTTVPDGWTCCFQFFQAGSALSTQQQEDSQKVPDLGMSCEVIFKDEMNMDKDVVEFVRSSGLNAEQQEASLKNLREKGIYKTSQFVGNKANDIFGPEQVPQIALSKLQAQQGTEVSKHLTPARSASDAAAAARARAEEMAAKVAQARQEVEQIVSSGQDKVSSAAQQQLDRVLSQLNAISVDEADVSTATEMQALNDAIASGGFVGGSQLTPAELIAYNGVFRGISLFLDGGLKGEALEFKAHYAQMPGQLLTQLYEMHPEANSQEFYLESQFASDLQFANGMVETYGQSAFSANVNSWQVGMDVAYSGGSGGVSGGGAGGQSEAKSGGGASGSHNSESEKMKTKVTTLYKSQYFFQPKRALAIGEDMLQLSSLFQSRCTKASYAVCTSMGLSNCSQWIDGGGDGKNHSNTTNTSTTEMTLSLIAILTNVNWNAFANNPTKQAFEEAATNYFADAAGIERAIVKVSSARPGSWYGGDKWTQVLLKVSAIPVGFQQHSQFMSRWNKGTLETGMLSAVLAAKGMSDCRLPTESNPNQYKENKWSYFLPAWQPEQQNGLNPVSSLYNVFEPQEKGLFEPTSAADQVILSLIYDYGTHICPRVTLGGWWRITANYVSTVSQERLDVEQAASSYITKAKAESWAYSADAGGAYGGLSGGASGGQSSGGGKGSGTNSSSGAKEETLLAMKNATMNVEQVWQGGAEGVNPMSWRRSLDEHFNSNWRVIERDLTRCVGLWMYVEDPYLSEALCATWITKLLESYNLTTSSIPLQLQTAACTTTRNMQYLIKFAQNVSAAMKEQEYASRERACLAEHPGNAFTPPNSCLPKQCYCTLNGGAVVNGTKGTNCPQQSDRDCVGCCLDSQRAACDKQTACAVGDILKPEASILKCQLAKCQVELDSKICCQPKGPHPSSNLPLR